MAYTKDELLSNLEKELENKLLPPGEKDYSCLYTANMINYIGNATGTSTPYTEFIGEKLFKEGFIQNGLITDIRAITRGKSYYTKSHEKFTVDKDSNRVEENFVKSLFFYNPFKKQIGSPIDYQTPLKNISKDKAGKIDLITYNEKSNELFLVEVKDDDSKETALRACLEIQTYFQAVDKDKLLNDFYEAGKITSNKATIKKVILFFKGSNPANELVDLSNRTYLKRVIDEFDIKICILDIKGE